MKIFRIKGLPPTMLYSEEPGYCSVVDTGAYSMIDGSYLCYVYWKIINNGNRPFLWIESPEKIFVIIRSLLEKGYYNYTIGNDPELRRNFSKINSENVIICIKYPTIDVIRNRSGLVPTFEQITCCLFDILENAKKIYNEEKEIEKKCNTISFNEIRSRLKKIQESAVEKEFNSVFGKNFRVVVDTFSLNGSRIDPYGPLFTIEAKTEVYPTTNDAIDMELEGIISNHTENLENLEQALNAYLGLYPDGGDNHITNIDDDTTIYTTTGMCEHKITIIMKNFDEEDSLHDER